MYKIDKFYGDEMYKFPSTDQSNLADSELFPSSMNIQNSASTSTPSNMAPSHSLSSPSLYMDAETVQSNVTLTSGM